MAVILDIVTQVNDNALAGARNSIRSALGDGVADRLDGVLNSIPASVKTSIASVAGLAAGFVALTAAATAFASSLKEPLKLKIQMDDIEAAGVSIQNLRLAAGNALSTSAAIEMADMAGDFNIQGQAAINAIAKAASNSLLQGAGDSVEANMKAIMEGIRKGKVSLELQDVLGDAVTKSSGRDDIIKAVLDSSSSKEPLSADKEQLKNIHEMEAAWSSVFTQLRQATIQIDKFFGISKYARDVAVAFDKFAQSPAFGKVVAEFQNQYAILGNLIKLFLEFVGIAVSGWLQLIASMTDVRQYLGELFVDFVEFFGLQTEFELMAESIKSIFDPANFSIKSIADSLTSVVGGAFTWLINLWNSAPWGNGKKIDFEPPKGTLIVDERLKNQLEKEAADKKEAEKKLKEAAYAHSGGKVGKTQGEKEIVDKLDEVKQAIESSFSFGSLYSLINQFISKQTALQTANANAAREAEIKKNKALLGNVANPYIAEIGRITKSISATSLKIAEIEKQQTAIPAQIAQLEKERTDYLDQVEDFQKQLVLAGVSGFTKTDIDQKKALLKYQISNLPSGDLQARGKLQSRLETISQIQVNLENATADAQSKQDEIDKLKETSYLDQLAKESKLLDFQKKSLAESEKKKREFSAAQTASQKQAQAEIDRLNAEANTASFSFKDMLLKVVSNWNGLWSDGLDGMKGLNSKLKEFADNSTETQNLVYKIGSQFLKNNTLLDLFYNIPLEAYKQASRDLDSLHQETEAQQEQYIASKAVLTEMMEAATASNNTTLLTSLKAQSAFLDDVNNQIQNDLLKQIDNFKDLLVFGLTKLFNDTLSGIQDSLNEVYSSMIRSPFAREMFDLENTISNLTKEFALFSDEMFLLQKRTEYAKQGLSEVDINTLIEKEKELAKLKIEAAKAEKEAAETNYKRNAEREFGFDKASFPAWDESKFKRKDINSFEIAQKMDSLDPNMYLGDTDVTIEAFRSKFAEIKDGIKEISKDFTDYLSQGAEALFGDFFERIGSVMGGGKFNAKELLKGFVDFLGQMLVSLGSTMLALGTQLALMAPAFTALSVLGLPQFQAAGATAPLLIAGGLGLIAAGSMVKGFSNAALGSKSGGGGSSASTSPSSNPSATRDNIIGQGRSNISPANLTVIVNAPSLSTSADIAMQVRDAMQYSYVVR